MGEITLDDILITPLQRITVQDGDVLHGMKDGEPGYNGFGEIYFSNINYNAIKAWKQHTKMIMNLVVPIGIVMFVFYSENQKRFRVEEIGYNNYARITVPPGIWFGFKGIENISNLVVNIASITHDPNEVKRCLISNFNFNW